eukprot:scaffold2691_cov417-Prasinococcus_capsulatus_cf.AAC.11
MVEGWAGNVRAPEWCLGVVCLEGYCGHVYDVKCCHVRNRCLLLVPAFRRPKIWREPSCPPRPGRCRRGRSHWIGYLVPIARTTAGIAKGSHQVQQLLVAPLRQPSPDVNRPAPTVDAHHCLAHSSADPTSECGTSRYLENGSTGYRQRCQESAGVRDTEHAGKLEALLRPTPPCVLPFGSTDDPAGRDWLSNIGGLDVRQHAAREEWVEAHIEQMDACNAGMSMGSGEPRLLAVAFPEARDSRIRTGYDVGDRATKIATLANLMQLCEIRREKLLDSDPVMQTHGGQETQDGLDQGGSGLSGQLLIASGSGRSHETLNISLTVP